MSDEATLARHAQTDCGAGDLLGQALARENMARAWKRVKANKGSAGVDGRTVLETGEYLKGAWPDIRSRLLDGTYRPEPVRRVGIPKPGGGARVGIPTVVDRLIQQAGVLEEVKGSQGQPRNLADKDAAAAERQKLEQYAAELTQAEALEGVFSETEDAQWREAFSDVPEYAVRSTGSRIVNALMVGSDFEWVYRGLVQDTGMVNRPGF